MNIKLLLWFLYLTCWTLNLKAQDLTNISKQKPFQINGVVDVRAIGYTSKNIPPRRSPLSWVISGSPVLSVYGIKIPVSFTFTEQERSFNQPFNQYGLSPTYKWITVHGGYRNVSFSPYTLAGHTMLGGGVELNPGKFRFGLMTGRLNRSTTIDTTSGVVRPLSFSRYGTAVKVGYGSEKNFIDLSYLQAKDRTKDIIDVPITNIDGRPASNSVLGTGFKVSFLKSFQVLGDAGLSVYTRDNGSDLEMTDSTRKLLNSVMKFLNVNGTSEYYLAYNVGVGYTSKNFSLKVMYKNIDPGFKSMGAYFFQDDLRNITINPTFNAIGGKLRFTGSVGVQKDNVKKLKLATTTRIIGLANISYELNDKFGVDANYANYTSNSEMSVTMVQNRYLLAQTNSNISVTPRLILPGKKNSQVVILSYNLSSLRDLSKDTIQKANVTSQVIFLNHNITLIPMALAITSGLNYTSNKLYTGLIQNYSGNAGFSKTLLKNKLIISSSNSFILTKPLNGTGKIWNFGGNISYLPIKGHRLSLRVNSMSNKTDYETQNVDYSELTGELGYTFNF